MTLPTNYFKKLVKTLLVFVLNLRTQIRPECAPLTRGQTLSAAIADELAVVGDTFTHTTQLPQVGEDGGGCQIVGRRKTTVKL